MNAEAYKSSQHQQISFLMKSLNALLIQTTQYAFSDAQNVLILIKNRKNQKFLSSFIKYGSCDDFIENKNRFSITFYQFSNSIIISQTGSFSFSSIWIDTFHAQNFIKNRHRLWTFSKDMIKEMSESIQKVDILWCVIGQRHGTFLPTLHRHWNSNRTKEMSSISSSRKPTFTRLLIFFRIEVKLLCEQK